MAVRLYVLVARQARRAVVFRRGPSKQVLLLSWDLEREVVRKGDTWGGGGLFAAEDVLELTATDDQ